MAAIDARGPAVAPDERERAVGPGERVLLRPRVHETRHLVVADRQAVISPAWSLHSGVGTASYSFVWAMAGENQAFGDMDPVPVTEMR